MTTETVSAVRPIFGNGSYCESCQKAHAKLRGFTVDFGVARISPMVLCPACRQRMRRNGVGVR